MGLKHFTILPQNCISEGGTMLNIKNRSTAPLMIKATKMETTSAMIGEGGGEPTANNNYNYANDDYAKWSWR